MVVLLVFVAIMMFVGNIDYGFEEDALVIEADFWGDMSINYDEIVEEISRDMKRLGLKR